MHTINDLTEGEEYTFTLSPATNVNFTGKTEVTHKASKIIKAKDLRIAGCIDNVLTVVWSVDEGVTVDSWNLRCYNDNGFLYTDDFKQTTASFNIDGLSSEYTIEVTAANMSVNEKAFVAANSITVTDFKADTSVSNKITLTWNSGNYQPEKGWILLYTVDGSPAVEITDITENSVEIVNLVPNSNYVFTLQTKEGPAVLGGQLSVKTAAGTDFSDYGVKTKNLRFSMCKTPSKKNWDKGDLSSSDYTKTFAANEKASFLVKSSKTPKSSKDKVTVTYVIRKDDKTVIILSSETFTWKKMWSNRYCELNIPTIPSSAGNYSIDVYFNGALAHTEKFAVK
jgi:hypothetical protein